jgi:hypothetical protein
MADKRKPGPPKPISETVDRSKKVQEAVKKDAGKGK